MSKVESNLKYGNLLGTFENCYLGTKGFWSYKLFDEKGQLSMELLGKEGGYIAGVFRTIKLSPYSYKPTSKIADGLSGSFSTEAIDVQFILYDNKGLMIIAAVIHFKKNEKLENWFVREFFFRK